MYKALLFDLNGTLIDIYTSESDWEIYRTTANFLGCYGVVITPEELKEEYFGRLFRQKERSREKYPEFDVIKLFASVMYDYGPAVKGVSAAHAANVFRSAGCYRLQLYSGVKETLAKLSVNYRLAAVSDGQKLWAENELAATGLDKVLYPVIISGSCGFRKPDPRMYKMALDTLGITPREAVFVGNDMYRDIKGAADAGMKTVFFRSNQGDREFHGAEPDYIINDFPELLNAVEFLERQNNN